jgi:hypothetical protein
MARSYKWHRLCSECFSDRAHGALLQVASAMFVVPVGAGHARDSDRSNPHRIPQRVLPDRADNACSNRVCNYVPCHINNVIFASNGAFIETSLPDGVCVSAVLTDPSGGFRFHRTDTFGKRPASGQLDEPVQVVRHNYERECVGVPLKFGSHYCANEQAAVCEGSEYSGSLVR